MQPAPLVPQLQTRSRRNRQVLPLLRVRAGNAGAKQHGALRGLEFQLVTQGEWPSGYFTSRPSELIFANPKKPGRGAGDVEIESPEVTPLLARSTTGNISS